MMCIKNQAGLEEEIGGPPARITSAHGCCRSLSCPEDPQNNSRDLSRPFVRTYSRQGRHYRTRIIEEYSDVCRVCPHRQGLASGKRGGHCVRFRSFICNAEIVLSSFASELANCSSASQSESRSAFAPMPIVKAIAHIAPMSPFSTNPRLCIRSRTAAKPKYTSIAMIVRRTCK